MEPDRNELCLGKNYNLYGGQPPNWQCGTNFSVMGLGDTRPFSGRPSPNPPQPTPPAPFHCQTPCDPRAAITCAGASEPSICRVIDPKDPSKGCCVPLSKII